MFMIGDDDGEKVAIDLGTRDLIGLIKLEREQKTFDSLQVELGSENATNLYMPLCELADGKMVYLLDEDGETVLADPEVFFGIHGYLAVQHDMGVAAFAEAEERAQEVYDKVTEALNEE